MKALDIIEEQKKLEVVEDLILDDHKIIKITEQLQKEIENLPDLICLSLNSTELNSLENFPNLPGLIRLELINNKFKPSDLKYILNCNSLQSLSLSNNSIEKIEDLEILKEFEDLIQIDLEETLLSKGENYRKDVFGLFKKLKILDNKDINGNDFDYSSDDEEDEESNNSNNSDEGEIDNDEASDDDSDDSNLNEEDDDSDDEGESDDDLKKLKED